MTDVRSNNVYGKPLHQHSTSPPTGVARDGFCRVPESDTGNHSVAGLVTEQFLDFTASQGNDLRKQVGLKGGQRWCLCASRWKEAFDAREGPSDPKVPKVMLHATNQRALDIVGFKDLKAFAKEGDIDASRSVTHPVDHPESAVRPSKEIGGKEPRA